MTYRQAIKSYTRIRGVLERAIQVIERERMKDSDSDNSEADFDPDWNLESDLQDAVNTLEEQIDALETELEKKEAKRRKAA